MSIEKFIAVCITVVVSVTIIMLGLVDIANAL